MLTLYYKPSCPYCQDVLGEAEALGIKLVLKDVSSDSVLHDELIERGGKDLVPYLVDAEGTIAMYESDEIITYLREQTGQESRSEFSGLKIHKSDESCDTCQ